jgi:hypothetical protein
MIQGTKLRDALKGQVRDLEDDLRERFRTHAEYKAQLSADWKAAHDAGRTAEALVTWVEGQFTQSAVAWVLACVFVRFCEDNGLLDAPLIAGADRHGLSVDQRQQAFYLQNPTASDNDYLRDVFAAAARLPGLSDVLKVQRSPLAAPVSADLGKQLVRFFRATDPDTGALVHDFADPEWNTRFLGDLYQELSEAARDQFALLQTPEFVQNFILDRTLTTALDIYTLEEVDLIDPTCGSGHFLLGAFHRLVPRWLRHRPDNTNLAIQEVLNRIAGVDLNPYAVAIARFRLLVAALRVAAVTKLRLAPDFRLHIETGDSLLHGFDQRDYTRSQVALSLDTPQANLSAGGSSAAAMGYRHAFAAEDLSSTNAILARKYAAVVGNPPYITVKDKAVSALYRARFSSCSGKYALVSPFCERFWALARHVDSTLRAGFVGLIVADSFMKREFGKKLVEGFFPGVDLTHVISTSGVYMDGHGTPTAILFGRNRAPTTSVVRAVMGINGEPSKPDDPAQGLVWRAIVEQVDHRGSESQWVSVADVDRTNLAKHPWSMGGGGAAELREYLDGKSEHRLLDLSESIGITSFTLEDNVYVQDQSFWQRRAVTPDVLRTLVVGDEVRDWYGSHSSVAIFPYGSAFTPVVLSENPAAYRFLWSFRTCLANSKMFGGETKVESGLRWYEYGRLTSSKLRTPLSIVFAEVATHNHFVLDRGGKVFKQTAPIIKLAPDTSEDRHLGLLGLLNSSTGCFWFKQVCFPKGGDHMGTQGARVRRSLWDERFAHDSTKVGQFPVVEERPVALAGRLDKIAQQHAAQVPGALLAVGVPTRAELDSARRRAEQLRAQMIALQEELDWYTYKLYDLVDEDLCYEGELPELRFGERAFEILLARNCAAGSTTTTWFERHGAQPVADVQTQWPLTYQDLVQRRIAAIERSRDLALVERPECKRRWAGDDWDSIEQTALQGWLLNRLEAADLWPRDAQPSPRLRSVRELVDALSGDESFRRALDLFAGTGSDAHGAVVALVKQASVPYLDALIYAESGLRKRAVWQDTWALQRREDVIDDEVARAMVCESSDAIDREQARRKAQEVGKIPVPPEYKIQDFRDAASWKLRGPLDVHKERFISFPGLERANDAGSPMVLWAGYDAKARALALTGYLYELQQRESTDQARLAPALAGLDEMLPWVHQWHPEVDDDLGMSTGDYLQGLLDAQLAQHGLTIAEVRAWQPPATVRRTRGRRSATT